MSPNPSYKKRVKFAQSRPQTARKKKGPASADSYANIVLHYMSKLKGLFRPSSSAASNYYNHDNYNSSSKSILKKNYPNSDNSDNESESRGKARDIVSAALQYGCANNIVEKLGDYFLVKIKTPKERVFTRRPTPGPDYIRCASCQNLAKAPGNRTQGYSDYEYRYNEIDKRKRSHSRIPSSNYCSKCCSRMKSNTKL